MIETVKATLVGVAPLLMSNVRTADPTNEWAIRLKVLSAIRNKTEEQLAELKRVEWWARLITNEKGAPSITADHVLAAIVCGAKKAKLGETAKAAVFETDAFYPLSYEGPKNMEKLSELPEFCDYRVVAVSTRRVMRARPRFPAWSCDVSVNVNTEMMETSQVIEALTVNGQLVGMGDYTPRFGRYEVKA